MAQVLIVEDEMINALLYQAVLEQDGHQVLGIEATESGAVAAAARQRPHLLLIDRSLRRGTGTGALAQILADGFIPHILLSGDQQTNAALPPGVVALRKPFTCEQLSRAVATALRSVQGVP